MDWEDDLLALAEAPAIKSKKKKTKKRKRECVNFRFDFGGASAEGPYLRLFSRSSASDMELSEGGSDIEALSAIEEGGEEHEDYVAEEQEQTPADQFSYEGLYKNAQEKAMYDGTVDSLSVNS